MLGVGEMLSKVFKSLLGGQIAKNFANIHGEQRAKIIQSTFPRHLKAWNRPPSYPASSIPLNQRSGNESSLRSKERRLKLREWEQAIGILLYTKPLQVSCRTPKQYAEGHKCILGDLVHFCFRLTCVPD